MRLTVRPLALPVVLLASLTAQPVRAEGNRLLPFWGQPYPSGYAWTAGPVDPDRFTPCDPPHRATRWRGRQTRDARCAVVLHARD